MSEYISILIPIYNGIEFFEESFTSVINQTYKNWELLIGINGRYNDNTYLDKVNLIIDKYNNKNNYSFDITVFNFDFKGKSNTLNTLVKHAKYNFIALLDVDDIWFHNKLEIQSKFLKSYDVIGTKCEYFGNINKFQPDIPTGDISNFDIFKFNPIINSSVIINKNFSYWNNDLLNGLEDYDLWFKLFFDKKNIYNVDNVLCYHRIHNESAFNNSNFNYLSILYNKWNYIKFLIK
jgi:glycosyltransferase involved in cell wall biosynthesis